MELLKSLPDASINHCIIDPPYGVLTGHKIETKIDISALMVEIRRILKPSSFFVFFGQMPTAIDWINEANKHFKFADHIVWAKRALTSPYLDLSRTHESLFIYRVSNSAKYVEKREKYEDLKTPAMHLGIYEFSSHNTIISDLQRRVNDNAYNMMYFGLPNSNDANNLEDFAKQNDENNTQIGYQDEKCNDRIFDKGRNKNTARRNRIDHENFNKDSTKRNKQIDTSPCRNDTGTAKLYNKKFDDFVKKANSVKRVNTTENTNDTLYNRSVESNNKNFTISESIPNFRYRSKWFNNITNLWSFMPENRTSFGAKGQNVKHPTVKPTKLLNRLINLISSENEVILDCFLGSGSTAVSCAQTGRKFVGCELDTDYYKIALHRAKKEGKFIPKEYDLFANAPVSDEYNLFLDFPVNGADEWISEVVAICKATKCSLEIAKNNSQIKLTNNESIFKSLDLVYMLENLSTCHDY
jgi:DNA modification methylase